jgi:hypothetical protein
VIVAKGTHIHEWMHMIDMDVMYYENTRTHGRTVLMYACRLLAVGSVVFCLMACFN